MTFSEGELDREDVRSLLALHFKEMRAESPADACHVLPIDSIDTPDIRVFSLRDREGRLLGVGALKQIDASQGEIKSMRTCPGALGRGVGRHMLARLVAMARDTGMRRISLETGNSRVFDAANHLYLSAGFKRCAPFGDYSVTPFTHFYSREI